MTDGEPAPVEALDFASYDLDGLRDDIGEVLDFGSAISSLTRWIVAVPVVAMIVSWIVFSGHIDSGFLTVVFVIGAGFAALPIGATFGGWLLARRRLERVTEASGRVVEVVGQMHGDVVRLRAGTAETSVQKVAVGILEEAVFPAVFGTVSTTAEGVLGPVGFLAKRATRAPLELVERSVISAVTSLPDRQIGDLVDDAADALGGLDGIVASVADDYADVRTRLTSIVQRVARTSLIVAFVFTIGSMVPLGVWWLIGWVAS